MLIVDAQIHLWTAGNPTRTEHRQILAYFFTEKDADALEADALRKLGEARLTAVREAADRGSRGS